MLNTKEKIIDSFNKQFSLEMTGCDECGGAVLIDNTELPYPKGKYHCEYDLKNIEAFLSKALDEVEKETEHRIFLDVGELLVECDACANKEIHETPHNLAIQKVLRLLKNHK